MRDCLDTEAAVTAGQVLKLVKKEQLITNHKHKSFHTEQKKLCNNSWC